MTIRLRRWVFVFLACVPFLAAPPRGGAQAARDGSDTDVPLTWERYLSLPSVSGFAWSPRTTDIAYVANRDRKPSIYVIDVASPGQPRFVTTGTAPAWSPDGTQLLYSSEGDLWIRPADGGEARRLTNGPEDERGAQWSPDGTRIAFMSTRSGFQDVWVVDASGGVPRQLTTKSMDKDDGRFGLEWSPDGKSIVFVSNQAAWDHDDLWLVPVAGGAPRRLTTDLRVQQDPAFSPDGNWLAVSAFRHEEFWYGDMMDLYLVNATTGAERKLKLPLVTAGPPVWSPNGKELLFSTADEGNVHLWRVALDDETHPTKLTYADGTIGRYAYAGDGRWTALLVSSPTRPSALAVVPPGGGDIRIVADVAPALRGVRAPAEVAYRSFDGKYIHGFLYLPPGVEKGGKWPALVQVHGGGTNFYRNGFNAIEQYFAQRGYIVLAINYRGSSSYGRGFQDLSTRDWGGGQAHDAAIAAAYLRSLSISTGKVGIYGYSYGGFMSMATIVRHPDAFDAAVAMAGVYDSVLAYRGRDRLGRLFTELGHQGTPETALEVYERTSAINKIASLKTPVLVMHGEADVRVPFNQFPAIVKALQENNKVFASHSYPGEPHGFRQLSNRVDLYTRCEQWLGKYLKGSS